MLPELPGTNAVRVIDVFVLGPAMIVAGVRVRGTLGKFILMSGIATILFNGVNLLRTATPPVLR